MSPSRLAMLLVFFSGFIITPATLAATWYVNGKHGSDNNNCKSRQHACKTIRHAISLASSGDSIRVAPAIYKEKLTINFSLKILGASATSTILDGKGLDTNLVYIDTDTADITLSKLTIRNGGGNVGGGGGIANSATLTVDDAIITGNRAQQGAGIENGGTITINRSTVSKNIAVGDGYNTYGGGIFNSSTARLTINNSTLVGNVARGYFVYGGAIYNEGGVLAINNSTLTGNTARDYGDAGAIENDYNGPVTISNSTISENGAFGDGGSAIAGFNITLQNSIVAHNHPGGNCSDGMISNGYNLSSDGTCNFNKTGDLNDTNPKLGTFGNHGGPTQTIPLLSGSPAIDAGNPKGCTDGEGHLLKTDQRGYPRPDKEDSGGCDMGAYERQKD
jgi:hypothetical protein